MNETNSNPTPSPTMTSDSHVKSVFDTHARQADTAALRAELTALCRNNADATWEALSLLDQYHRRGLVNSTDFKTIKQNLNALVFGAPSLRNEDVEPNAPPANAPPAQQTSQPQAPSMPSSPASASPTPAPSLASAPEPPPPPAPAPASIDTAINATSPIPETGPHRPGDVLCDRYVLVAPFVSTATATIFKAFDRQREGLPEDECYVSIKCLRDEYRNDTRAQEELRREFSAAQKLFHPNIVSLYDHHQSNAYRFIVMEFIRGQLLSHTIERIAPHALDREQALAIIRQIGLALMYAHTQGITHMNLAPSRITVLSTGEVRIFGFCAAERALENTPEEAVGQNDVLPIYQSEQRIRDHQADTRDDLYSLACIAYHLLAGRAPFIKVNGRIECVWRRIAGLRKRQWNAIRDALHADRAHRPRDIGKWLLALETNASHRPTASDSHIAERDHSPRTSMALYIAAGVALVVAGAFIVNQFSPFEQLAVATDTTQSTADQIETPAVPDYQAGLAHAVKETEIVDTDAALDASKAETEEIAPLVSSPPAASPTISSDQTSILAIPDAIEPSRDTPITTVSDGIPSARANVSFLSSPTTVYQGEPAAALAVRRTGSTRNELLLEWRTLAGSAKANVDFVATENGTLRFAPGERNAVILVPIIRHGGQRFSEWFDVEISGAGTAELGAITRSTVFIVGDQSTDSSNGEPAPVDN
jgi:serine/threonine protein kinase